MPRLYSGVRLTCRITFLSLAGLVGEMPASGELEGLMKKALSPSLCRRPLIAVSPLSVISSSRFSCQSADGSAGANAARLLAQHSNAFFGGP